MEKIRKVFQHPYNAAVVCLEEDLQDQAGEQLMLGELPGAEAMGVRGQGPLGHLQRNQRDLPWRLAGSAHPSLCNTTGTIAPEEYGAFLQSKPVPLILSP